MKANRRLSPLNDHKRVVKILLSTCAATAAFSAISVSPHWTARLVLSAAALLVMVYLLGRNAPVGYEDETGFHYAGGPRAKRRARRRVAGGALFGSASSPLGA